MDSDSRLSVFCVEWDFCGGFRHFAVCSEAQSSFRRVDLNPTKPFGALINEMV